MDHDDVAALATLRGIRANGAAHHLLRLIDENAALRERLAAPPELIDLVTYWLELVRASGAVHEAIPVEALTGTADTPEEEMARLVPPMAAWTTQTRLVIEEALLSVLRLLGVQPEVPLRLVASPQPR